jgi:hypothetical protein
VNQAFSHEIQPIIARIEPGWPETIEVGPGWYPLLSRLDERLSVIAPGYVVQQVKAKFGALSFFARPSEDVYDYNEEFCDAILAAEWESTTTCEECGAPARTYTIRMWVWALCKPHARAKAEIPAD